MIENISGLWLFTILRNVFGEESLRKAKTYTWRSERWRKPTCCCWCKYCIYSNNRWNRSTDILWNKTFYINGLKLENFVAAGLCIKKDSALDSTEKILAALQIKYEMSSKVMNIVFIIMILKRKVKGSKGLSNLN